MNPKEGNHAEAFLTQLEDKACQEEAKKIAAYHKVPQTYLGVKVPPIAVLARAAVKELSKNRTAEFLNVLWEQNIHETCVGAGKIPGLKKIKNLNIFREKVEVYKNDLDAWVRRAGDYPVFCEKKRGS